MAGDAEGAGDLLVRVVRSDQTDDLGLSGSESQAARNGPGIRDGCARRGRLDHETSLGPMVGARYTQTEGTCGRDGKFPPFGCTGRDRKSTRLNSSHRCISYAVFCLKKKKTKKTTYIQK